MNEQLGNEQGRFIEAFDRELRNQIGDHERRQAFEQELAQGVAKSSPSSSRIFTLRLNTRPQSSHTLKVSTAS